MQFVLAGAVAHVPICQHGSCEKQPSFGDPAGGRALFCADHKGEGMSALHAFTLSAPLCSTQNRARPSAGSPNEGCFLQVPCWQMALYTSSMPSTLCSIHYFPPRGIPRSARTRVCLPGTPNHRKVNSPPEPPWGHNLTMASTTRDVVALAFAWHALAWHDGEKEEMKKRKLVDSEASASIAASFPYSLLRHLPG